MNAKVSSPSGTNLAAAMILCLVSLTSLSQTLHTMAGPSETSMIVRQRTRQSSRLQLVRAAAPLCLSGGQNCYFSSLTTKIKQKCQIKTNNNLLSPSPNSQKSLFVSANLKCRDSFLIILPTKIILGICYNYQKITVLDFCTHLAGQIGASYPPGQFL